VRRNLYVVKKFLGKRINATQESSIFKKFGGYSPTRLFKRPLDKSRNAYNYLYKFVVKNAVVIGLQWGDEGKGKIIDYLAADFGAIVRFNGGSNAGHTVKAGREKHIFHIIPSGALRGKQLYLGSGVVLDPDSLRKELEVENAKVKVDYMCSLVTPFEKWLDRRLEELRGGSAIGTTGRGIGPAYATRMLRVAPRVADLIRGKQPDYTSLTSIIAGAEIPTQEWVESAKGVLKPIAADVPAELREIDSKGDGILFEGAQGALLDLDYGTYPFVTSSHTIASYVSVGAGFSINMIDNVIGVAKAYQTRVGAGPFPTELGGALAEDLRTRGEEFGSTTGRPRRVGWLDLVSLKYSVSLNEPKKLSLIITKADVLSGMKELKVAVAYSVDGRESTDFTRLISCGSAQPIYEDLEPLPGTDWGRIAKQGWDAMPIELKKFVDFVENYLRVEVSAVSIGPEREMIIERR